MSNSVPAIRATKVSKGFEKGGEVVNVLCDLELSVSAGQIVSIVGASGVGKSTLLHVLSGLEKPTQGEILLNGEDIGALSQNKLAQYRNSNLGFVFQFHHLLKDFSASENVAVPLLLRGESRDSAMKTSRNLLDLVGLAHRASHLPGELSGGEQQRVAIARALSTRPVLLFADEPTGNLDEKTSEQVFEILTEANRQTGCTLVYVTHNPKLAQRAHRVMVLSEGKIADRDHS